MPEDLIFTKEDVEFLNRVLWSPVHHLSNSESDKKVSPSKRKQTQYFQHITPLWDMIRDIVDRCNIPVHELSNKEAKILLALDFHLLHAICLMYRFSDYTMKTFSNADGVGTSRHFKVHSELFYLGVRHKLLDNSKHKVSVIFNLSAPQHDLIREFHTSTSVFPEHKSICCSHDKFEDDSLNTNGSLMEEFGLYETVDTLVKNIRDLCYMQQEEFLKNSNYHIDDLQSHLRVYGNGLIYDTDSYSEFHGRNHHLALLRTSIKSYPLFPPSLKEFFHGVFIGHESDFQHVCPEDLAKGDYQRDNLSITIPKECSHTESEYNLCIVPRTDLLFYDVDGANYFPKVDNGHITQHKHVLVFRHTKELIPGFLLEED